MFAVLHIADFALHAVLRTEPGTSGKPAALFSGTGKKSLVLAANLPARTAGVELGMSAPQAVARCPALLIRAPHAGAETDARAALLATGFLLSPAIEDTAAGVCTVDLKGADADTLSPAARQAVAELARLGLPATAGIARTPLLALYAARATQTRSRSSFSLSFPPNSSDMSFAVQEERTRNDYENEERVDPTHLSLSSFSLSFSTSPVEDSAPVQRKREDGEKRGRSSVLVVSPADEKSFLGPLLLAAADPSPQLGEVLAGWGLRTLGDLTALPRDEIVRRFGAEGLALWQRAAGGEARPLHRIAPPQEFSATLEFEQEIEMLEPLLFIVRRFLDRLTLELRAAQFVAAELDLVLSLEDDTRHALHLRLPEPTCDVEILFRALHTQLEALRTPAAITALQLRATPARPLVRQQGLFETGLRDPHGFAETLARVAALVGSDRLGTPQLADTHRPDTFTLTAPAAVITPAAEPPPLGSARGPELVEGLHPPLGLPLRRFRPPLPARVELTDGQPTYLWSEHVRGEIATHSTAYTSSGDWWQPDRAWARCEWDITLREGGLYRLLRTGEAWFIEGEYD